MTAGIGDFLSNPAVAGVVILMLGIKLAPGVVRAFKKAIGSR